VAEIEIGDMKVSGSKMLLILPLIGTLAGALWGGFEVYQRLLDAEEAIVNYVEPDLSGIEQKLEVINTEITLLNEQYAKELDDMNDRIRSVESLARTVDSTSADTQRDVRNTVYELEQRVNNGLRDIEAEVRGVRKELDEKIERILDNPLNNED
jgi:uncharacterized protein YoxC